jgi:hypothetical protein
VRCSASLRRWRSTFCNWGAPNWRWENSPRREADRSEKIFRTLGAPGESYLKSFVALRRRLTT